MPVLCLINCVLLSVFVCNTKQSQCNNTFKLNQNNVHSYTSNATICSLLGVTSIHSTHPKQMYRKKITF